MTFQKGSNVLDVIDTTAQFSLLTDVINTNKQGLSFASDLTKLFGWLFFLGNEKELYSKDKQTSESSASFFKVQTNFSPT